MSRNGYRWLMGLVLTVSVGPTLALDAASTQAYCNAVKQAAANAQTQYVQTYTPVKDPQQTFMDSTNSCMAAITDITVAIPPQIQAVQPIIQQLSKQLLTQACQAARQEFNNAVQQALQQVNTKTGDVGLDFGLNSNGTVNYTTNGSTPIGTVVNSVGGSSGSIGIPK